MSDHNSDDTNASRISTVNEEDTHNNDRDNNTHDKDDKKSARDKQSVSLITYLSRRTRLGLSEYDESIKVID